MKRLTLVLLLSLVLCTSAWGATVTYAGYQYWPAGQAASTSFSPSWFRNTFYKTASFDTTVTFIDNVSYSWHATVRSSASFVQTYWLSSQMKKAHCRANTTGPSWAACTAYS